MNRSAHDPPGNPQKLLGAALAVDGKKAHIGPNVIPQVESPLTSIAKEKATATQLKDMICKIVGLPMHLAVMKMPQLGWKATVIVRPDKAINAQAAVDAAVAQLRAKYDLAG
jgi:hypothetical protein